MKREFSPLKAVAKNKMAPGTEDIAEPSSSSNDGVRTIPTALSVSGSVASDVPFLISR